MGQYLQHNYATSFSAYNFIWAKQKQMNNNKDMLKLYTKSHECSLWSKETMVNKFYLSYANIKLQIIWE